MKSTVNPGHPGQPAIAAIPAVEPTLTIELTKDEASKLCAITGRLASGHLTDVYEACYAFAGRQHLVRTVGGGIIPALTLIKKD